MNEIQNSLLEAMQMLSSDSVNKADNSPVITCEIVEVIDAGLKTYKVKYLENEFPAISNSNAKYSIGELVYILVPNGDFSKDKLILGSAAPSTTNFIQTGTSQDYYNISNNLIANNISGLELNSYKSSKHTIQIPIAVTELLNEYIQRYRTVAFGFDVRTSFDESQRNGNYGMIINIPVAATEVDGSIKSLTQSFVLDIEKILGTPYDFKAWSPQSIYFNIEEQFEIDITRSITIDYFCSGFNQNELINKNDIFFKNIFLKVVNAFTDEDNNGYHLILDIPQGNYFLKDGSTTKTITPKLRVNGEYTSCDHYSCYWFIEDGSITPDHAQYSTYGGRGWRLLQEGAHILEVDISAVAYEAQIKCVLLIGDYLVSNTVYLKNLNSSIDIQLYPTLGSATFIKGAGYVDLTLKYYEEGYSSKDENKTNIQYIWELYDKSYNFIGNILNVVSYNAIEVIDGYKCFITRVKFPVYMIEDIAHVYCHVAKVENGVTTLLGTEKLTVSVSADWQYRLVINNGNKIYKYDSDGDSPLLATYDGPAGTTTVIEPLSYQVFKLDGTELTEEEYLQCKYTWKIPVNSMFEIDVDNLNARLSDDGQYYLITGKGNQSVIPYTIARRFDKSKADNHILLQVDFLGNLLDNIINISFLKEGAAGTNGTKYAAVLGLADSNGNFYPYGARGGESGYVQKLHFLYNTALKKWYWHDTRDNTLKAFANRLPIKAQVYENGELLSTNEYSIKYSAFDERVTNPCFNISGEDAANITVKAAPSLTGTYCNIIQAQITVSREGNQSAAAADTILYAYYPIELTVTNLNLESKMQVLPTLEGGFSEVLYATDGTNPQWDSSTPFYCDESILSEDLQKCYSITWDAQHHIHLKETLDDGSCWYYPSQKYDDGSSQNYVKATLAFDTGIKTELNQLIATNNALITEYTDAIENIDEINNSVFSAQSTFENYDFSAKVLAGKSLIDNRNYAYQQALLVEEYVQLLIDYINNFHSSVFVKCPELKTEVDTLVTQINNAKKYLQDLKAYSLLIDLTAYKIAFDPLLNEYCLYELNRGVASTLGAYISDINQAILGYQKYYNTLYSLGNSVLLTYSNIFYKLNEIYNSLDDRVSIKASIKTGYIDKLSTYFNYNEFLNCILKINTEQFIPYLAAGNADKEVALWQEVIAELTKSNQNAQKVLATEGYVMTHIRPIVLTFNRYEMSNINAWDGNKIYTGNDDEFLLAPQVGAGYKETDNSFTGMVIGLRNTTKSNTQTGLFGYHKGQQSIFLNAKNGSATFGKAGGGGQIIVDPNATKALLYSSTYYKNYDSETGLPTSYSNTNLNKQGMLIDLSTPEIRWGNNNFYVEADGSFGIGNDKIAFDATTDVVSLNNVVFSWKGTNAFGQSVNESALNITELAQTVFDNEKTLKTDYDEQIDDLTESTAENISELDAAVAKHLSIEGGSTLITDKAVISPYIGGGYLNIIDGKKQVVIDPGNLQKTNYIFFAKDSSGNLTMGLDQDGNATFNGVITTKTGGNIAGWTINETTLVGGNITLNSEGSLSGGSSYTWAIAEDGTATFNNVVINGGKLTIGDNFAVSSTGSIIAKDGIIGGAQIVDEKLQVPSAYISGQLEASQIKVGDIVIEGNQLNSTVPVTYIPVLGADKISVTDLNAISAKIAGWTLDNNSIRTGTLGEAGSMWLCRSGTTTRAIIGNSKSISGWCIGINDSFGVTKDGILYAKDAHLSGVLTSGAGSKIGPWVVNSNGLSYEGSQEDLLIQYNKVAHTDNLDGTTTQASWRDIITAGTQVGGGKTVTLTVTAYKDNQTISSDYKLTFVRGVLKTVIEV